MQVNHILCNTKAAFVVVTQMLRDHRSVLNHILSRHTSLPVIRVEKDIPLEAGKIYVITENTTLTIVVRHVPISRPAELAKRLSDYAWENCIDILFAP